ncbi:hypothetical protein [Rhizobium wenxiniae]|uniref:hypothetical protein n=1 Tax=Rhizobium wenxiniae TaxID=1737357 RepID=UPI003C1F3347
MRIRHDWWKIICKAWSVRLWLIATLIMILAPLIDLAVQLSDGWSLAVQIFLRVLSGFLGIAGIWARTVKQKEFEDGI